MSLFGSLFTGVSALSAQSQSMGVISNNIANVNTVGYKRSESVFSSLVTASGRSTQFSPGGVRAAAQGTVNQQGLLQQSQSTTDVAISGNGFFAVQRETEAEGQETFYTRAGSFQEDARGFLRNASGFVLMGWPLDADGNLPAASADTSSLQPVDVAFLGGLTRPTTDAELVINLDARQDPTDPGPHFNRAIRVFDSLGEAQDLNFNFNKINSPTANDTTATGGTYTSALDLTTVGTIANGNTFTVAVGGGPATTITIGNGAGEVDTGNELLVALNAITGIEAFITPGGELEIRANNPGQDIVITDTGGTPAADLGIAGTAAAPAFTANTAFPTLDPTQEANTAGWWQVDVTDANGNIIESGEINFDGAGQLNAQLDGDNQALINLTNVNWGNGSDPQDIDLDFTNFSQFAGEYNVVFADQNGAELGLRTGVRIDDEGFVIANFSNGAQSRLYKLPVATFANPNGLEALTGNIFRESIESGDFNLREAGQGGSGVIAENSLEQSNVDLADEFSKMIITQRAYSAGTKVINTSDQMLAELMQIR